VTTTAAAAGTRRHTGTYPAEPAQVRVARAALARWLSRWLGGWPRADEAVLIAPEFAANRSCTVCRGMAACSSCARRPAGTG